MGNAVVTEIVIRSLEEDLSHFDTVLDATERTKEELKNTAMHVLRKVELDKIDPNDTKALEAVAKLTSTALKVVDSQEASASRRVSAKVKLSEVRRSDNVSELVTDLLVKMHEGTYTPDHEKNLPTLEAEYQVVDEKYISDRLDAIPDTELRTDPDDVH